AAVAEAGVGLLLEESHPGELLVGDDLFRERIEQQIHDVVGERTADQELHREVVDALRVVALVGLLRAHPALGQDVAHGAREGLEALSWSCSGGIDDGVEYEMAFVEPISISRELNRAAAVLLADGGHWISAPPCRPAGHLRRLSHPLCLPGLVGAIALHVTGLVPQSDDRARHVVLVAECAQTRRAQHEESAMDARRPRAIGTPTG